MNNYGIILNSIGWKPMVDRLQASGTPWIVDATLCVHDGAMQREVLGRISDRYWPHIKDFDGHHTFIVRCFHGCVPDVP